LLLEGPEQEGAALAHLATLLASAQVLVTFNGKAFDWPLIRTRFVLNKMRPPPELAHLDLLHVARRVHKQRIGRCTLKDVESRVLGFERVGDIDGALIAAAYGHYLRSGDGSGLRQVIEHNSLDVASMAALVGLYGQPIPDVDVRDLPSVARTYRRAKALDQARDVAHLAVERGGGGTALRARAEVHKALGERLLALHDYEAADAELDDPDVRLELGKLYEHFQKDPERALGIIARGTSERDAAHERRSARLQRKLTDRKLPHSPRRR
jgi:DNA polymerase III epsilon subunit-like protein